MANNNKKRSTRRAFGRRALAFGVAMFAMVTLTAVGFAAWLISTNSTAHGDGGIVTQSVSQANIEITVENVNGSKELVGFTGSPDNTDSNTKYEIVYAAPEGAKGLITWTNGTGNDKPENLTFSFKGYIENAHRVGQLYFSVKVPQIIIDAAGLTKTGDTWTFDPAAAYVELPACAVDENGEALPKVINGSWDGTSMTEKIAFENITDLTDEALKKNEVELTIAAGNRVNFIGKQIAFKWGKRYNNTNPAILVNEERWTEFDSATGIAGANTNLIMLELLNYQAEVNGKSLETNYCGKVEGLTTAMAGKSLKEYVQSATSDEAKATVQGYLTSLQSVMSAEIYAEGFGRPTYTLFIEANVRS